MDYRCSNCKRVREDGSCDRFHEPDYYCRKNDYRYYRPKEQKKRKWLVRDNEGDWFVWTHADPPTRDTKHNMWNWGAHWKMLGKKTAPTMYGHALFPGGGPIDVTDWQPKEPDSNVELMKEEFADRRNERKEDTMNVSRFDVDVIRKPTVVGEQGGETVKEVGTVKDILASDERVALLKAGAAIGAEALEDGSRLVVRLDARPF